MSTITINPEMVKVLGQLKDRTGILDGAGRLIGTFIPAVAEKTEQPESFWSPAELEEAEKIFERERGQGMTTEELMRYLHSLESSP